MNSEDHANADIAILIDGVVKCKRKGYYWQDFPPTTPGKKIG